MNRPAATQISSVRPTSEQVAAYGAFSFLYLHSPSHQQIPAAEMRMRLMPPITLSAYHIHFNGTVPVAAMTWAKLNGAAERRFLTEGRLDPHDWASGEALWFVETIAPFNNRDFPQAHKWARDNLAPEATTAHYVHVRDKGRPPRVVQMTRRERGWRLASFSIQDWLQERGI